MPLILCSPYRSPVSTVVEVITALGDDIYYDNTVLLLHMDGTEGSNTFTDVKGKTLTVGAGATVTTARSKFGGASASFTSASDSYIDIAPHKDFLFNGDFTIEFNCRFKGFTAYNDILGNYDGASANTWSLQAESNGRLTYYSSDQSNTHIQTAAGFISLNTWYSIACVRKGTTVYFYINGALIGTRTVSVAIGSASKKIRIGGRADGQFLSNVDIDELRITNGSGRYIESYTPVNSAFADSRTTTYDSFYNNTSLLMHMEGANNSTVFTDAKGNAITVHGAAKISTAQKKFGSSSAFFNSAGSGSGLKFSSRLMDFADRDHTIEFNVYPTVLATGRSLISASWAYQLYLNTNGSLSLYVSSSGSSGIYFVNNLSTAANVIATDTMYHVAVSRCGTVWRIFVNGINVAETTASGTVGLSTASASIGSFFDASTYVNGGAFFDGYIDEVRITLDHARYTTNFVPPTSAFLEQINPDVDPYRSSNKLLLHFAGANNSTVVTDERGHTVTNTGVKISTAKFKFDSSSAYFAGASYLTIPDNGDFTFGTGDFTIECSVNPSVDAVGYGAGLISRYIYDGRSKGWDLAINRNNAPGYGICFTLYDSAGTSGVVVSYSVPSTVWLPKDIWYHIAVTRRNGVIRIFLNGNLVATEVNGAINDNYAHNLQIGSTDAPLGSANSTHQGYIDEVRITKGVARYVTNFTPQAKAFSN